jgi:fucose permease
MYFFFRGSSSHVANPGPAPTTQTEKSLPALYWVYWVCIVLAVSAEFCMISWSADYLQTAQHMLQADASQSVSLFFTAMIIGRVAGSRLVQRFSVQRVVPTFVLTAIAGFLLYWQATNIPAALAGLFITGLGIASMYPLILSMALAAAGSETVRASAGATLASGTAILTLPVILGRLADATNIQQAYGIVLLLLACVLLIVLLARKISSFLPGREAF